MELIDGRGGDGCELFEAPHLTIFTKGDKDEQQIKVDRSGLGNYFRHAAIVKEKNEQAYLQAGGGSGL